MKALPSIAFNEFRGTASEVTARVVGGRTVLGGRAQHSRVKTPKQALRRANFSFITKQFKTLSEEQLSSWATLAAAHRESALIGNGAPLTAHNLFVCLNSNRSLLGVSLTKDAPSDIHGSSYVAFDDMWITPEKLIITGLVDNENPSARLVVKMASSDSKGTSPSKWGQTVIVSSFHTSDWGDIDMTEIYTAQFGVPIKVGRKYFVEMYWIDENSGYISEVSRIAMPATEAESISGQTYVDRVRLTAAELPEDTTVESLDMELSPGSAYMTTDLVWTERVGSEQYFLTKNVINETLLNSRGGCVGRAEDKTNPSFIKTLYPFRASIWFDKQSNGTTKCWIARRGGTQLEYNVEAFGTYPATPR